ncbi:MAG: hypothetical protein K2X69_03130 [Silvanigrellaceae bacterium]|nr:hypothetical protein [Silvanigrellaceae bacterium]
MNTKIILLSLLVIFYQSKNLVGMERLNQNTHQEETRQSTLQNPNLARSETMYRSTISSQQKDPYPHYTIFLGLASLVADCGCEEIYTDCDQCHKKLYEKIKKR